MTDGIRTHDNRHHNVNRILPLSHRHGAFKMRYTFANGPLRRELKSPLESLEQPR